MINFKDYFVGFGFLLLLILYIVQRIRVRSKRKKEIIERKNKRKKRGIKENKLFYQYKNFFNSIISFFYC